MSHLNGCSTDYMLYQAKANVLSSSSILMDFLWNAVIVY